MHSESHLIAESENKPETIQSLQNIHAIILNELNIGIIVVDWNTNVLFWNRFLEVYSGYAAEDILGKNLYEIFPDLNQQWLERKLQSVWLLKSNSYISWKDIPYLFRFRHNRPITGYFEYMYQDVAFIPLMDNIGQIYSIALVISDATDIGIYQHQIKEAEDVIVMLEELAHIDSLTGISNRFKLENDLKNEFARSRRYGRILSIIMFDLDFFKKVNDNYGHLAGDQVLRVIAGRVRKLLRAMDICGRYGGEEFCVVLPETNIDGALEVAERMRKIIAEEPVLFEKISLPITASFGVTNNQNVCDYRAMMQNADEALYFSKRNGRNQVHPYICPDRVSHLTTP